MQLRYYQREAINAAYDHMRVDKSPALIVLPTGAGKSAVISTMAKEAVEKWNGRVLIVSHVKELLEQVAETIKKIYGKGAPVGIYSAGLKSREKDKAIIVAGIQSIYTRAEELGRFDLILVDEAHLIPHDGDGMYQSMLKTVQIVNPNCRLIGLTATAFRMDVGLLYGDGMLFSRVCYEAPVGLLIAEGWLSNLRGKDADRPDLSGVRTRGGEYIASELQSKMADREKVNASIADAIPRAGDRIGWLVFCCGVDHAKMVSEALTANGVENAIIIGDTPSTERAELIAKYKARQLKCLVSVGVLTTGFDAPHVDLIIFLRPTKSAGLYIQMAGRGLRKADGKKDCLILDYAGVISEHGPIDAITSSNFAQKSKGDGVAPTKTCPECCEILPAGSLQCNFCGHEFERELAKHHTKPSDKSPISNAKEETYTVKAMEWRVHTKKDADESAPKTLRVIYKYDGGQVSEWVCIEHMGWARKKAEEWWRIHASGECPTKSIHAFDYLEANKPLAPAEVSIVVKGKYPELVKKHFVEPGEDKDEPAFVGGYQPDEELPF